MATSTGGAIQQQYYRIADGLNAEWRELADRTDDVRGWASRQPGLAGFTSLADVLVVASRGSDAVLYALLAEGLGGDKLAARTVLQALLGRVIRMSARDRRASLDDYVAALWCVIAGYPLAARPARIAANLALDTLKLVHRDSRWGDRPEVVVWLPGDDLDPLLDAWLQRARLDHALTAGVGAAEVIQAGRRLRLLDDPVSQLLQHVYVDGLTGVEAAARNRSTAGSVRVRCSRAIRRLAAHAVDLAEAA